ncbi:hypothetical protein AB182_04785 [Phytobacter ursingii]|uniref:Uncharacterized protein n=1 Tax=Phytobacter ursingii TaxID=1972431 RepID=A0AAC8QL89_9ENTR|nr:hypothetical protein AB182_04785 [Phytobacter ursingii]
MTASLKRYLFYIFKQVRRTLYSPFSERNPHKNASTIGPLTLATRAPGQENHRWRGTAAPVSRQRLIDFQPAPVIAVTVLFSLRGVIAENII